MAAPTTAELLAQLHAERQRRLEAERLLGLVAGSALTAPVSWVHRLTRRGPDMAAVHEFLGSDGPAAPPAADPAQVALDDFHRRYYEAGSAGGTWQDTWWLGTQVLKLPLDLWLYQELVAAVRPDVIVECGTKFGGSAFFLAGLQDLLDHGRVITIDIDPIPGRPEHPRVTYLLGSSTDPAMVSEVTAMTEGLTTMVILDSLHFEPHVYDELQAYSSIVSVGSYMVVEDTNLHGRPVRPDYPRGPGEALDRFLAERDDFAVSPLANKFLVSFNPDGVLQRLR